MSKIFLFVILSFLCINTMHVLGQDLSVFDSDPGTEYRELAMKFYNSGNFYEAVSFFELASSKMSVKSDTSFWIAFAESSRKTRNYSLAENVLSEMVNDLKIGLPDTYYWLATMKQVNGKYTEAIDLYNKYLIKKNKNSFIYSESAKIGIKGCSLAINELKIAPKYLIDTLKISGVPSASMYGASIYDDMFWLTSSVKIKKSQLVNMKDVKGVYGDYYIDRLYFAKREKEVWIDGKYVENIFYSLKSNYLPLSFHPQAKLAYLSICSKAVNPICRVNFSNYEKSSPFEFDEFDFPINAEDGEFSTRDFSASNLNNKEIIVFSSNRSGGSGGYDLYWTESKNGIPVGEVFSFGNGINTSQDEISPYYDSKNQTLYFSSNGHAGFGNYDVFKIKGTPFTKWGEVENMGSPINSGFDEYYFYQATVGSKVMAYVSSNRQSVNACCDKVYQLNKVKKPLSLKLNVYAVPANIKLLDATVSIIDSSDMENQITKSIKIQDSAFIIPVLDFSRYYVTINRAGFPEKKLVIQMGEQDTVVSISLKKESILLYGKIIDSELKEGIAAQLKTHKKKTKIEFDSINTKNDGLFTVNIPVITDLNVEINSKGYLILIKELSLSPSELLSDSVYREFELAKIKLDLKAVMGNIEFEFGKSTLKPESFPELDRIVSFMMKNPTVVLEISGHTDNKGAWAYNKKLSETRAKTIVNYMVSKGIQPQRLAYFGYSYDQPVGDNNTVEGANKNRRVEFKIIE